MLKSTRLVLISGTLLGLSVAFLPQVSRATTFVQSVDTVSATIDGYLAFDAISHTATTGVSTYANNAYIGTFQPGGHTEAFGVTKYRVTCNFLSDNDFTATIGTNTCQYGWSVTAEATNDDNSYATMVPEGQTNAYRIKSDKSKGLTGSDANWLMKVTGIERTFNGNTTAPSPYTYSTTIDFGNFESIPFDTSTNKTVVTGYTFTPVSGTPTTYSYNGYQEFEVTYGFSAGMATADTYTGEITYTLHINAS